MVFSISCSTEPLEKLVIDPDPDLVACFETNKVSLSVGENLIITSCSKGASTYMYDFGNGESSSDQNPSVIYDESGEFTILLIVTNEAMETKTSALQVTIISNESFYIYPDIAEGFSAVPLEIGIHPVSGKIYMLELLEDLVGPGGSKFYYREFDESFVPSSHYIADKPFESNSAFVNFYPSGNMNFIFSRTLDGLYGTQEVTYNNSWGFLNGINSATKHSYGNLPDGANFLYFGTEEESGIYKAAIETRNSSGDAFDVSLNNFGAADAMIGDMIPDGSGYIAFGAVFSKNDTNPKITNYKPLLIFYDASLNVVSHIIYDSSILDTIISSSNDLNGSYHLEQLDNGNIVMYAHGEFIITNSSGAIINSTYYEGTKNNQAMISLGDSFVLSSDSHLRKLDGEGNQLMKLNYGGTYLPEILEIENNLFFMAGQESEGTTRIFYGSTNTDLELVAMVQ